VTVGRSTVKSNGTGFYTKKSRQLERGFHRARSELLPSAVRHSPVTAVSPKETARAGTSPAPDITATVAPFRAWRGLRLIVAEKPTRAAIEA
jgi:hypothetical protein